MRLEYIERVKALIEDREALKEWQNKSKEDYKKCVLEMKSSTGSDLTILDIKKVVYEKQLLIISNSIESVEDMIQLID